MPNLSARPAAIRAVIVSFLLERRDGKLDKLSDDDPKRAELMTQFQPEVWIDDAARRASQIQAVTHSLKPIHPDAKGTSLYRPPSTLPALPVVSSHCLGKQFTDDVVGNAAALDVYKFLKLECEGHTLLALMLAGDPDIAAALGGHDTAQALNWIDAFTSLIQPRGRLSSHTLAKQLYWLAGEDPLRDEDFHLLAPLHATSLAQHVYDTLQDDRFSDAAKAARQAKKDGLFHERPVRSYPNLAVQKLGGTKPQNISQLNNERLGQNFLLASLPPNWHSQDIAPLLRTNTLFNRFSRRSEVRYALKMLILFLANNSPKTMNTRDTRDELADVLIDEFLLFGAALRELTPGWSDNPECRLPDCEKVWLDSGAFAAPASRPGNWLDELTGRYANWLNAQLGVSAALKMGDSEHTHWRRDLGEALAAYEWELNHVA